MISCASFCTYDGSPPRNIPCEPDSGLLKSDSLPFSPFHVLNSGCCFIRYVGMNQPMCPITPEPLRSMTDFSFVTKCVLTFSWMLFQSSSTTSTLPSVIAWKSGVLSGSLAMLTLQPKFFSSTYLTT